MRILSFDPGSKNMAYCITDIIDFEKKKYRIVESGMFLNTIKDLKGEWVKNIKQFEKELKALNRKHKPTHFVAERYILRRIVTGGTTTEGISMMLGISGYIFQKLSCKLVTAAIWKNAFGRAFEKETLKEVYKQQKKSITPHQIDASLIGLYLMYDKKHFLNLKIEKHLKKLQKKNLCPILPKVRKQRKTKK